MMREIGPVGQGVLLGFGVLVLVGVALFAFAAKAEASTWRNGRSFDTSTTDQGQAKADGYKYGDVDPYGDPYKLGGAGRMAYLATLED